MAEKQVNFPNSKESGVENKSEAVKHSDASTVRIWYNDIPVSYSNHWHTAMEVILPIENSYEVITSSASYTVMPGEILVLSTCESHELHAPQTGKRLIYLFDLTPIRNLKDYSLIQPLIRDCLLISRNTHPQIYDEAYRLFLEMKEEYFKSDKFREMSIQSKLLDFFVLLGKDHQDTIEHLSGTSVSKQREYVQKFNVILEYIDAHYMENLTLDDIAGISGFSKFHFTRLFKRYTTSTFYDYLNLKRTKEVQRQLVESDFPVTEIALSSGFTSITTFNRIFRKYTGCTPTAYRAINQRISFSK